VTVSFTDPPKDENLADGKPDVVSIAASQSDATFGGERSSLEENLASPVSEADRYPPLFPPSPQCLTANSQFFRDFRIGEVFFALDFDRHVAVMFTMLLPVTARPQGETMLHYVANACRTDLRKREP
jgi:hypothetical protein